MSPTTRLTVADYDRMIEEGFFAEPTDIRIELIEGELHHMSPIGVRHEAMVDRLMRWAVASFPLDAVSVRIQQSLGIPAFDSVPQPDVVIVAGTDFIQGRPLAEAVWLMIEVADSSLRQIGRPRGRCTPRPALPSIGSSILPASASKSTGTQRMESMRIARR